MWRHLYVSFVAGAAHDVKLFLEGGQPTPVLQGQAARGVRDLRGRLREPGGAARLPRGRALPRAGAVRRQPGRRRARLRRQLRGAARPLQRPVQEHAQRAQVRFGIYELSRH